MNISSLIGGIVDTEKVTRDTIQGALEDVAEEIGCSYNELFIKISATDNEFNPVFHIFHTKPMQDFENIPNYRFVREISLKEILGK
jgi:hypothetical protein